MDVDKGRLRIGMPSQRLSLLEAGSSFDRPCDSGMPERVSC